MPHLDFVGLCETFFGLGQVAFENSPVRGGKGQCPGALETDPSGTGLHSSGFAGDFDPMRFRSEAVAGDGVSDRTEGGAATRHGSNQRSNQVREVCLGGIKLRVGEFPEPPVQGVRRATLDQDLSPTSGDEHRKPALKRTDSGLWPWQVCDLV